MSTDVGFEIEIDDSVYLPVYRPLLDSDADIDFLWGGRDSGKSTFVAQKLVVECLESDYFRCVLIKKTYNSIKGSQWQMIKDIVDEWGLSDLFIFNKNPLEIRCINGNTFLARGCDDPGNVKSMANPSHAWYEEGNQLSTEDMVVISTTLRSKFGKVKQYFSFNPEAVGEYTDHWLWSYFKDHVPQGIMSFTHERVIQLPDEEPYILKYTSTHTTYHDNEYVRPERKAALENLANIDPYWYDVFTLGIWGNKQNKNPFVYAYDATKHNGFPEYNPAEVIYLSFDFNKNPMCCTAFQHYEGKVRVLRVIKLPNSSTPEVCEQIKVYYPTAVFMVTGDASGKNRSALVKGNVHHYTVIKQILNLGSMQFQVPTVNPPVERNGLFVNTALATYPFEIHELDAKPLLDDFRRVRKRPDGSIEKGDREDEAQQADALDTFRYFCNTFLQEYINFGF